jgi:hypothetical protein
MPRWIWHIDLVPGPVYRRIFPGACSGTLVSSLDLAGSGESRWRCGDESDPGSFRFNFRISSDTYLNAPLAPSRTSLVGVGAAVRDTYPVLRMEVRNNNYIP